ncbi:MAG TPA: hypothetical protein VE575_16200 [Acidimicrobiales bacterium]|nr:hypothetical protein [Acidimicrobiales bacterium]
METTPKKRAGWARYWPVLAVVVVLVVALVVGAVLRGDDGDGDDETAADSGTDAGAPPALAAFGDEDPLDAPDCDPETGRLAIPTLYSPNCVPVWPEDGDNGGETYQGVTEDEIVVAYYDGQDDPTAEQIGEDIQGEDAPSDEEDMENRRTIVEVYNDLFETYGRTVRLEVVEGTGPNDDDAAARADAIRIATDVGAFAVVGGPTQTTAYADELAARGVICLCASSQPIERFEEWAPYVWGGLMASTQAYVHRADYITDKLAGQPAEFAGDPELQSQERSFGIVYYETADSAYQSGVDFFEDRLADSNVELTERIPYILDLSRAQEDAATIVARLKDAGVTSVVFAGDPFFPIYLTQAATSQDYRPEWVITGSTGTDSSAFARQYDQEQWAHAFGISALVARVDPEADVQETNPVEWATGEELAYALNIFDIGRVFTGVHLAGPNLTPETFRDGLFSYDPINGYATAFGTSYGTELWPFTDYTAADDVTEVWWDPEAEGMDEADQMGQGLYRYANEGQRYLPGEIGESTAVPFEEAGTVTLFDDIPDSDRPPEYEPRTTRTG